MPKVYNKRHNNVPKDAVYIGRPSKWGNPFEIGKDGDRGMVVLKYRNWMRTAKAPDPRPLRGKDLVCWCRPKEGFNGKLMCHGQILAGLANDCDPLEVE